MSRPLRINIEDGWYHVFSRGVNRRIIFRDDRDRRHFLELLEKTVEQYHVMLHGYVLMDNHYHLIVQAPDANLSRAIQWLNQSYAGWFIARYQKTGQVLQRPFGSRLIENSAWASDLSVYLHLNPLRIPAFSLSKRDRKGARWREPTKEQVRERLKMLRSYSWSSYRSYAGYQRAPGWLHTADLLSRSSGKDRDSQVRAYCKEVQDRLREGVGEGEMERVRDGICVGGAEFIQRMKSMLSSKVTRESVGKREVRCRVSIEEIIDAVAEAKGERWEDFRDRHGDCGKVIVMVLARKYAGVTLGQIGDAMGGKDYAAVCMAVRRFQQRTKTDKKARQLLAESQEMLYVKM